MKVVIKIPGILLEKGFNYDQEIDIQESITLGGFLKLCGLSKREQKNLVIVINKKMAYLKQMLCEGDEIIVLSTLIGG